MEPDEAGQNTPAPEVDRFLTGGGELAELIRRKNSSQIPFGPIVRRLCGQFSRAVQSPEEHSPIFASVRGLLATTRVAR